MVVKAGVVEEDVVERNELGVKALLNSVLEKTVKRAKALAFQERVGEDVECNAILWFLVQTRNLHQNNGYC